MHFSNNHKNIAFYSVGINIPFFLGTTNTYQHERKPPEDPENSDYLIENSHIYLNMFAVLNYV
jgi:hypothetical protein